MTEKKIGNLMKFVDSTTVIYDKIDGIAVISNFVRPPPPMECSEIRRNGVNLHIRDIDRGICDFDLVFKKTSNSIELI